MSEAVSPESWFRCLGESNKAIVAGVVIFLAAFPLLWWNEGRAIQTAKTLKGGATAVHETTGDRVNPEQDCKVVHLTGEATTDEVLKDPQFHISANAIRLTRKAEMCQWEETKSSETREKMDGVTGTVTTYSYRKTWSDREPNPMEFVDQGDQILLRLEEYDTVRLISMRSEGSDEAIEATPLGHSVGRWEGRTLVVETDRINWRYFSQNGLLQSEAIELVERFTPSEDGARLDYELTITDPALFTEPAVLTNSWVWVIEHDTGRVRIRLPEGSREALKPNCGEWSE